MNNNQLNSISNSLVEALLKGDSTQVGYVLDECLEKGISLQVLYVDVIGMAQCQVGELWAAGKATIAQEHRATQIIFDQLSRIRQSTKRRKPLGHKAIVASLPGDFHILGGRIVADLLSLDGWDVDFLGADTPIDEIVRCASDTSVSLIGMSVSHPDFFAEVKKAITQIRNQIPNAKIMVGGRGVITHESEAKTFGADALVRDGNQALEGARRIVGVNQSGASLSQTLSEIGGRIHANRKALKMSQEKLAAASGLDRAYISSVENGKQNVTIGALLKLTDALGIELSELIK